MEIHVLRHSIIIWDDYDSSYVHTKIDSVNFSVGISLHKVFERKVSGL